MTPDEVSKKFPNYALQWITESRGAAAAPVQHPVNPDGFDVYASVSLCDNRLWAISSELDPDTDYLV